MPCTVLSLTGLCTFVLYRIDEVLLFHAVTIRESREPKNERKVGTITITISFQTSCSMNGIS